MIIEVQHRSGAVVWAQPQGSYWGPGDRAGGLDVVEVDTDIPIAEVRSRYMFDGVKLVLLPESQWTETLRTLNDNLDAVVFDPAMSELAIKKLIMQGKAVYSDGVLVFLE